jgi:hypothetical protein
VEHPLGFLLNALSVALRILEILCFALYAGQGFLEIKNPSKEANANAEIAVTSMNGVPFSASLAVKK